jgi:hypothetical protein
MLNKKNKNKVDGVRKNKNPDGTKKKYVREDKT